MTAYYVIRHKGTRVLLPARVAASSFEFKEDRREPRLFKTERAAKNCVTCWAQGLWERVYELESDGPGFPTYSVVTGTSPAPIPGRNREDLEVVRVEVDIK